MSLTKLDTLKVGDRVAKNGRRDGTGRGTVVAVGTGRGLVPLVTVRYDSGALRTARSSLWVKV
jgi:hypothetical protein